MESYDKNDEYDQRGCPVSTQQTLVVYIVSVVLRNAESGQSGLGAFVVSVVYVVTRSRISEAL